MIHYSCDLCHQPLDAQRDQRYIVRIEVYPALEPPEEDEWADDRDHLLEIHESLECGNEDDAVYLESHQELRYDLCADCRKRFARDPLRRELLKQFDFSEN